MRRASRNYGVDNSPWENCRQTAFQGKRPKSLGNLGPRIDHFGRQVYISAGGMCLQGTGSELSGQSKPCSEHSRRMDWAPGGTNVVSSGSLGDKERGEMFLTLEDFAAK